MVSVIFFVDLFRYVRLKRDRPCFLEASVGSGSTPTAPSLTSSVPPFLPMPRPMPWTDRCSLFRLDGSAPSTKLFHSKELLLDLSMFDLETGPPVGAPRSTADETGFRIRAALSREISSGRSETFLGRAADLKCGLLFLLPLTLPAGNIIIFQQIRGFLLNSAFTSVPNKQSTASLY
jgi:hypothetical protein